MDRHTLAGLGVDRVSLGVQDFAPRIQQAIGRIQPFDVVNRAVGELGNAGITRINLDLMYGLPGQTVREMFKLDATEPELDLSGTLGWPKVATLRTLSY